MTGFCHPRSRVSAPRSSSAARAMGWCAAPGKHSNIWTRGGYREHTASGGSEMSGPQFMPFYIGDYLRDTQHLSTEEHGIYLLLLMACWTRGALPDDRRQLSAITKIRFRKWPVCRRILDSFFVRMGDGLWHQKRIDKERQKIENISDARSKAGSKGAANRWQSDSTRARTITTSTARAIKEEEDLTPQSPPSRGGGRRGRFSSAENSPRAVQARAFFEVANELARERDSGTDHETLEPFRNRR